MIKVWKFATNIWINCPLIIRQNPGQFTKYGGYVANNISQVMLNTLMARDKNTVFEIDSTYDLNGVLKTDATYLKTK
jgi:hypothetical protein